MPTIFYDVRYEFSGRSLKVHYDRFSASQASTLQLPAPNVVYNPPIQIPISYLGSVLQVLNLHPTSPTLNLMNSYFLSWNSLLIISIGNRPPQRLWI